MSTKIAAQEISVPTYHECCESYLTWWKISESFHDTESPHGFGRVDGDNVIFQDDEVAQLLSDPAAYGLSEGDVALIKKAMKAEAK